MGLQAAASCIQEEVTTGTGRRQRCVLHSGGGDDRHRQKAAPAHLLEDHASSRPKPYPDLVCHKLGIPRALSQQAACTQSTVPCFRSVAWGSPGLLDFIQGSTTCWLRLSRPCGTWLTVLSRD